jgi:hypothetical protein
VWCWGAGFAGQIGDGDYRDSRRAIQAEGISGVAEVTAGAVHTCARVGGTVQCWGDARFGQLADGVQQTRTPVAPLLTCP